MQVDKHPGHLIVDSGSCLAFNMLLGLFLWKTFGRGAPAELWAGRVHARFAPATHQATRKTRGHPRYPLCFLQPRADLAPTTRASLASSVAAREQLAVGHGCSLEDRSPRRPWM